MTFTIPTLLQVRGLDDDDNECVWYAEAVGRIVKDDEYYYEGYYLVPSKTNDEYLVYDETYDLIPEKSTMARLAVKDTLEDAWEKMGFILKESRTGTFFIKIGEPMFDSEESDDEDIGSIDSYSTDESDDRSNISDLIDDSEVPTSCISNEAMGLNEDFASWVPKDEKERRIKSFIESLEHRAALEQDERTF